ncbi:MAG: hypothetical protein Q8O80_20250, partial [Devosia sp.]|nr:hypothetical protein [Devosia sp.]
LDVLLHGTTVFEVADLLRDQRVPFLFATAYDRRGIPSRFRETRLLEKPLDRKRLLSEIVAMTTQPIPRVESVSHDPMPIGVSQAPPQTFARALARKLMPIG